MMSALLHPLKPSEVSSPITSAIPQLRGGRPRRTHLPNLARRRVSSGTVRAVISRDDKGIVETVPSQLGGSNGQLTAPSGIQVKAVISIRKNMRDSLIEEVKEQWQTFINGIGKGISIQLVSEEIDPDTNSAHRSAKVAARGWLPKPSYHPAIVEYTADFTVPSGFGRPGAVLITNLHSKEFYLVEIVVHDFPGGPIFFPANSWIHSKNDNPESRIVFSNQAYLPSQTPDGLKDLRQDDLISLRGNGKGERKKFDRIYDYDTYNDLGHPDKDSDLARPILGDDEKRPYPRRCRTGRLSESGPWSPLTKRFPEEESTSLVEGFEKRIEEDDNIYVPRDETFEEDKQATFSSGKLKATLHNLIPFIVSALSGSDDQFGCFSEIDKLYREGVRLKCARPKFIDRLLVTSLIKGVMSMGETLLKYETPLVISRDRFSWLRDAEFARQTLAGVNPVGIERLREFPILSKLDPKYGESALTKEVIESQLPGMSIEEAIEKQRLFLLDHHDLLLPFVENINLLEGRKAYASRTVFFFSNAGLLEPIAIELSLPTPSTPWRKNVYTHGHDATTYWIWKLAKAHVCSNDAGVHQLVSHWLRTHACMEPYVIAAHRQLSTLHPIFKLLHPHMRYTMEINALARQSLINGGGIIEDCFAPGKYSMELSSAAYKNMWRFDMEALPADLLRRGMAVEDSSMPCGIKLVFEDYPYAADGLLIWSAIKDWVHEYVSHFYADSTCIASDVELQAWWDEIKNKGHFDKRNEPWWPKLHTKEDLEGILTTMIWIASGQHAAINFGQYPFGGYMPNRPTLMKKLIPEKDDGSAYESFLSDPQRAFLSSVPSQLQATKVMAVQDTLSTHSKDEEYLGEVHKSHGHWIHDSKILESYENFSARLKEIEEKINERNKDWRLKNRNGAGIPPYELLLPTSGPGVTGRGIPNSISI